MSDEARGMSDEARGMRHGFLPETSRLTPETHASLLMPHAPSLMPRHSCPRPQNAAPGTRQLGPRHSALGPQDERMNRKNVAAAILLALPLLGSCSSYNAYQKARTAELSKDWDQAVLQYEKALTVDPENLRYKIYLQRSKLEASRAHFEKAKSLRAAALTAATLADAQRLNQLAATEFEITVKLDTTNQYAAVELGKAINAVQDAIRAQDRGSIDEIKKRAKANITKAQPPQLNPASDVPLSLTF